MTLLIDGYNLLHASGILGRGIGPGGLERSRHALLNFLVESLDPAEVPHTVVVFDAPSSARSVPHTYEHRGLTVHFSSGHADADELIEQLIRRDSTPRRLTVVSSDHRVQRAAKRRRARAVDSDKWFASVLRARIDKRRAAPPATKPPAPLDEYQVRYWLRQFGAEEAAGEPHTTSSEPAATRRADESLSTSGPAEPAGEEPSDRPKDPYHPFPPGYAEDVTEEDL